MNLTSLSEQIKELRAMKLGLMKTKMATVLRIVSCVTEIEEEEIRSKRRYSKLVDARYAFMYICHVHLGFNLSVVGRFIDKDHATVIHAKQKVNAYISIGAKEEVIRIIDSVVDTLRATNNNKPHLDMEEIKGVQEDSYMTEMDKVFEHISYTDKRIEFWQKRKEYLLDLKQKMYQHR